MTIVIPGAVRVQNGVDIARTPALKTVIFRASDRYRNRPYGPVLHCQPPDGPLRGPSERP